MIIFYFLQAFGIITYSIFGDANVLKYYQINPTSGVISMKAPLTAEPIGTFTVSVLLIKNIF